MYRLLLGALALLVLGPALRARDDKFAVGKVAPEIVGRDVDGKRFKLSDYRGKVVLLDFWGHW
jgi:hypothetical protein